MLRESSALKAPSPTGYVMICAIRVLVLPDPWRCEMEWRAASPPYWLWPGTRAQGARKKVAAIADLKRYLEVPGDRDLRQLAEFSIALLGGE